MNSPVKEINWNSPLKDSKSGCKILLESGENFEADHVICTTSLAVLKKNHLTMFKPELPLKKQQAIKVRHF